MPLRTLKMKLQKTLRPLKASSMHLYGDDPSSSVAAVEWEGDRKLLSDLDVEEGSHIWVVVDA